MLIVDTSVWVDYFQQPRSVYAQKFDSVLGRTEVVLGDLILVEILQGLREGPQLRLVQATLKAFRVLPLCGPEIAPKAAANYWLLRNRGITVRGTIDVIIATWCIEHDIALLHHDREFTVMEKELGLTGWAGL